jgi:hypothetical protein
MEVVLLLEVGNIEEKETYQTFLLPSNQLVANTFEVWEKL